jgi:uncharacterized membrane protein YbhN (UPF0104 family)
LFLPLTLLALPGAYLLALRNGRLPLSGLVNWASRRFPTARFDRVTQLAQPAEIQVSRLLHESPGAILKAILVSIIIWIAILFEFNLALTYLGIQMSLLQVTTALIATRLAFLLPVPAGLGTLEAGLILAMQALGFNPAFGISLSLLIRARDVVLGGFGLWLGGVLSR